MRALVPAFQCRVSDFHANAPALQRAMWDSVLVACLQYLDHLHPSDPTPATSSWVLQVPEALTHTLSYVATLLCGCNRSH